MCKGTERSVWGERFRTFRVSSGVGVKRFKREEGASAVEFAIIASLLLVILFGTITFGIVFNRYQGLQAAGREGARLGALQGTTGTDIINRVRESVSIIAASSIEDTSYCAGAAGTTPSGLNEDEGCVRILRRTAPGATPVLHSGMGTPGPCNASQSGGDQKSVIVEVHYKLRIDIPLWASPVMTVSGTGEFRCE